MPNSFFQGATSVEQVAVAQLVAPAVRISTHSLDRRPCVSQSYIEVKY
ncbi:MAG: hypothetical protein HY785_12745 [Oscillatoriophycideae cyanobacterium NC_groundwater_1537_Pr4_S-0.65um_50_18]|nr:hypothetical protein [Oscillatoriophycideae cyanobacterium NC_groundwater_1537_Pr4_S-0.65um_50_18]